MLEYAMTRLGRLLRLRRHWPDLVVWLVWLAVVGWMVWMGMGGEPE